MKKVKIAVCIGVTLLFLGALVFGISFALSGFDIQALSEVKTVTRRFDENTDNPVQTVKIDFENAHIEVRAQDGIDALAIEYPQPQNQKGENISEITVDETEGKISIVENYKRQLNLFSWDFSDPTVVLYLPAHRTYVLELSTSNGAISFTESALNTSAIVLKTNNGAITSALADIVCSGDIKIETDNGAIKLGAIQANALHAETDNGAIVLSGDLKTKDVYIKTSNGSIEGKGSVIHAENISLCTNLGSISVKIAGKQTDYTTTVEHDLGNTNIHSQAGGEKQLSVSSDLGDIQIDFTE